MKNLRKKTEYKNKRGSVLVFAVFLLMFFVIMGAVILRAGELSVTESIRFYRSEQAYFSAKSTTDLIIAELKGTHKVMPTDAAYLSSPFAGLYQSVQGLPANGSVSSTAPADVAQASVDVTMKCTKRDETPAEIVQTILVTSYADFDGEKRSVSREISLKTLVGKLDAGIIGTQYGANDADYDISGNTSLGIKSIIRGGMNVDNANIFRMSDVKIEGDLYIHAQEQITLTNVEVTGNLYLYSEHFNVTLSGCSVLPKAGDTLGKNAVITSSLTPSTDSEVIIGTFKMTNCDLYIRADRMISGTVNKGVSDKIYAFSTEYNNLISSGNIIEGDEAFDAHTEKFASGVKLPLTIDDLVMPAILPDNVIDVSNVNKYFDDLVIDVSGNQTIDYEIRGALPWLNSTIKVRGDGTVNFWVNTSGGFDNKLKIERLDDGKAAVNFIKEKGVITDPFMFTLPPSMSLAANIISPFHKVIMNKSQVQGNTISSSYQIDMQGEHEFLIDNTVPWGHLGSLVLMPPTVMGTEGLYKKAD